MDTSKNLEDDEFKFSTKRWIDCDVEHEYFGEERKIKKTARKQASAKDRSKYKVTDQRQELKQPKEFKGNKENCEKGIILQIASQGVMVDVAGHLLMCGLKGILKKEKTQFKNLVTVGDFVLVQRLSNTEGIIIYVEPRRSVLSRAENLSRRKEQLIAANIDQVMITISVVSPVLKPPLIDRYIIAAQKGKMNPVIVINKVDLLESNHGNNDQVFLEKEQLLFEDVLKTYRQLDIPVICVSAVSETGFDELKENMKNKISVFSGQSGVGKSSLINKVTGKKLAIGGIVDKTNKGSHTTSAAQLLPLEFGGFCIDTPGIKSFGVWNLEKHEIENYFTEIFMCGHQCQFPDCSHFREENCAVMKAVELGEISHLRYESYLMLMYSSEETRFRR